MYTERTIKSEKIYEGKVVTLQVDTVELPGAKYAKREIVGHAESVGIIGINNEGELLLIKQFRKPVEKTLVEIPAGKIELKEEPKLAAAREFEEETGYKPGKLTYITEFFSTPGFSDEKIFIFLAEDLVETKQDLDADELIEVTKVDFEKALKLVEVGEITDAKTIIAILVLNQMRMKCTK